MGFPEKFCRTPKFVVWLVTAALGYGAGYVFAELVIHPYHGKPLPGLLRRLFENDWDIFVGWVAYFAVMTVFTMVALAFLLRFHHQPSKVEILLAIPVASIWPAWLNATDWFLSALEWLEAWSLYAVFVLAALPLCFRLIRPDRTAAAQAKGAASGS